MLFIRDRFVASLLAMTCLSTFYELLINDSQEKYLKTQRLFLDIILKEWLLFASAVGLIVTSIYFHHIPSFSVEEIQVIFILAVLFIAVKGLEHSGLILRLSQLLEKGKFISVKLVVATFLLSMLVTNDIALIVIVPLTLLLDTNRKDILVIFEALAANAGSALTPFGNPQNLFIYWFYGIRPETFILSIAPFSVAFLIILVVMSLLIRTSNNKVSYIEPIKIKYTAFVYGALLLSLILAVLHILPVLIGVLVIIYAAVFDRKSLKIDYMLLLTFICFFGLAENMKSIFSSDIEHSGHIFIFSALVSQVISNVPATLLFAKFTAQWKALLWGSNVGGFGSLMGSLANLIAYRLYIKHESTNNMASFTIKFMVLGYIAFFIGLGLYFWME
ncbi:MAG: hypothetical protein GXO75_09220 [Calditrichaeota bacterium]|nr:hypothetical protein [Calditrichota bacterium]